MILLQDCRKKDRRGIISWMVTNPVAANIVMLFLLIGGFLFAQNMKQEVFPEFELDIISISVSYPGSTPEDVETGILQVIEEAARNVDDVSEISSVASEGSGRVNCELVDGADIQQAYQDIKAEIDRITTLPEDAEEAEVTLVSRRRGVMELILYGPTSETILRATAENLRDALLALPGVTIVEMRGVRSPEIRIDVSQETLRAYGLTLEGIAQQIKKLCPGAAGRGNKNEQRRNPAQDG